MAQGKFLSWPPPLLNLLPVLLSDPSLPDHLWLVSLELLWESDKLCQTVAGRAASIPRQGEFIHTAGFRDWVGKVHRGKQNLAPECWDEAVDVNVGVTTCDHCQLLVQGAGQRHLFSALGTRLLVPHEGSGKLRDV